MTNLRPVLMTLLAAAVWTAAMPSEGLAQKRQRDRISRDEILNSPHRDLDLYQVIRSLRPHFLERPPGVRTLGGAYGPGPLVVYVDGVQTGLDALRMMTPGRVEDIRYLDPVQSENEYGPRANGGALVIRLQKPPKPVQLQRDSAQPPPRR
jgi:hypothetical protein